MAHRWALYLMITTTAAYPAAPLDLPPLGQTGLTDASMNNNNNNNNNSSKKSITTYRERVRHSKYHDGRVVYSRTCLESPPCRGIYPTDLGPHTCIGTLRKGLLLFIRFSNYGRRLSFVSRRLSSIHCLNRARAQLNAQSINST